jgi:hypothetical protein
MLPWGTSRAEALFCNEATHCIPHIHQGQEGSTFRGTQNPDIIPLGFIVMSWCMLRCKNMQDHKPQ